MQEMPLEIEMSPALTEAKRKSLLWAENYAESSHQPMRERRMHGFRNSKLF
ncbi:hypothetical protein [Paraburkholderia caledonica]|uniref:hypothetical protein n=1 Tax=Paraburkholderia caledonica TaxID=134536 RepID=UPI00035C9749|nr:hypothetical protein [Paraburkholderia caledonica]